jgi:hypothetical protein
MPVFVCVSGSDAATSSTTLVDVTGLSASLAANSVYWFTASLLTLTSADSTGTRYGVNFSAAGATIAASLMGSRTTTTAAADGISAFNTSTGSYMTSSAQSGGVQFSGRIATGANVGSLTIQHLKISSGTSTVKVGSCLTVTKVN